MLWWAGLCSLPVVSLGQTMVGVLAVMETFFKRTYGRTIVFSATDLSPLTHASAGDSWTLTGKSGLVSGGVTAPFSWVLVHTRFCWCLSRVCFPSPVEVLLSNPTVPRIPLGFSVPFLDPQVGKSLVGLRTFATMQELL